jgi:molybdenum cofactor biosynthesis protein B
VTVHHEHRERAPRTVRIAILTLSDTRTEQTDESGRILREGFAAAGHTIAGYRILKDDPGPVREQIAAWADSGEIDAIVTTGGTGVAPRDHAYEVVSGLLDKTLDGFGELFRRLSFDEIGSAAMLSRAVGGVRGRSALFALPGSSRAVRLAMDRILLPEIAHLVGLIRGHSPYS